MITNIYRKYISNTTIPNNSEYLKQHQLSKCSGNRELNLNNNPVSLYNQISFQGIKLKPKHDLAHYEGCILGGAIGDALGAPVEFLKLSEICRKYGPKGITLDSFIKSKSPLEFTDDTQMSFFTADGLIKSSIKNKSKYKIDFMDVFESYRNWLNTQMEVSITDKGWIGKIKELYQVKSPGNTCVNSILNNQPGTIKQKINDSKGNGGVMRSAPIGLLYYSKPSVAFKTAVACTALTHSNPDAYLSAGAFSAIISHIIQGKSLEEAVQKAIRLLRKFDNSEEIIKKLEQSVKLANSNTDSYSAIEALGRGYIGSEALSLSIYSALKNKMIFSKSVEMSSNINGDSDTVAAITGNIVGAYNGISGISAKALKQLKNCNELKLLSKDLFVQHNNIAGKRSRYPIESSYRERYNLDRMLNSEENKANKKKYQILDNIYKKISSGNIRNYNKFLILKEIPENIIEKTLIPIELIDKELKNKKDFNKFVNTLFDNYETLIQNENRRGCFADEKYSLEDILWTLYEKVLAKKNISNTCREISYMIISKDNNIKSITDYISSI